MDSHGVYWTLRHPLTTRNIMPLATAVVCLLLVSCAVDRWWPSTHCSRENTCRGSGMGPLGSHSCCTRRVTEDLEQVPLPINLEVEPYYSILEHLPLYTFRPSKPCRAEVVSVERLVGPRAHEVCHVTIRPCGRFKHWEGQRLQASRLKHPEPCTTAILPLAIGRLSG